MRKLSKSKSGGDKASGGGQEATALRLASYRGEAAGGGSVSVPSTESPKVSPSSPEDDHGASSSAEPVAAAAAASDQRGMSGLDQPSTSRGDVVKVRTTRHSRRTPGWGGERHESVCVWGLDRGCPSPRFSSIV